MTPHAPPGPGAPAGDGAADPPRGAGVAGRRTPRSVTVTGDRVLLRPPDTSERASKGGILIPATARSVDRKGIWGHVVSVGPNVRHVDADDEVLYLPEDAIEVDVKGDAYLIVRERDVHAIASYDPEATTGLYL